MPKILALFLLPVMLLLGANPAPSGTAASAAKTASAQPRLAVNDAQLDATIRMKLAKSKIGKDGFRYRVQRGVVTWEGTTKIGQHKGAATRMARTSGAIQVINNIKVANTGSGTALRKAYVQP
jgi:BON domain